MMIDVECAVMTDQSENIYLLGASAELVSDTFCNRTRGRMTMLSLIGILILDPSRFRFLYLYLWISSQQSIFLLRF